MILIAEFRTFKKVLYPQCQIFTSTIHIACTNPELCRLIGFKMRVGVQYQQIWLCGYNNMGGESTELLKKLVDQFFALRGIILSDNEGLHICSSFSQHQKKQQHQKFIQTTTLLISALNQTNGNLQKTKTYSQLAVVNFYYDNYLIHLAHSKQLIITLFMAKNTNVETAREISNQTLLTFQKLNSKVNEIRVYCS